MLVGLCTIVFKCTLQRLAEVIDYHDEVQTVHPFDFAMMACSTSTVARVISSQHNSTAWVSVYNIMKDFQFSSMVCVLTGPG